MNFMLKEKNMKNREYVDYVVYSITNIKKKYGFRIKLIYSNNEEKIVQKSGFSTKKDAKNMREQVITELRTRTYIIDETITIQAFLIDWLEDYMKSRITSASYDSYKNIIYNHIIPNLGKKKITAINKGIIQDFYKEKCNYSVNIVKL